MALLCLRRFSDIPAIQSVRCRYSPDKLLSMYKTIDLKGCEIFDEDPSILWRPDPLKNINLFKKNIVRDGMKYLTVKSYAFDYLSYFPLHQNELIYPLRTKYSTILPISHSAGYRSPLRQILPPNAKTKFTDIDKSKSDLISSEEEDSLENIESNLCPNNHAFASSSELGAAFHFIPPEADSVYKSNVRSRKTIRNKLPPARSLTKKVKSSKK